MEVPLVKSFESKSTETLVVMAQHGDREACGEVLRRLGGMVRRWVAQYNFGTPTEDLFQDGLLVIVTKAVPKFDVARGFKFATYAKWWVRRDVQRSAWKGKRKEAASLNDQLGDDSDTTKLDLLADPKAHLAFDKDVTEEDTSAAKEALKLVTPREAKVLELRFGMAAEPVVVDSVLARLQAIEAKCLRAKAA